MEVLKTKKITYFLGAGATIDVAPDVANGSDLLKKAFQSFPQDKEVKSLKDLIKHVFKKDDVAKEADLWNLINFVIQREVSLSINYNYEIMQDLRNNLLSLLIRELDKSLKSIKKRTHNIFINKLKETRSTIISTNYDIVIDNALYNEMRNYNYGTKIRHIVSGEYGADEGLRRPMLFMPGVSFNAGELSLLKIHGSLNWLYCPKCDEVDVSIGEKGVIKTLTGLYCSNKDCTSKYQPLLITPTMFKDYENRVIKETWDLAEEKLSNSDWLVFIGYSLPEEDYYIRCLLLKARANQAIDFQKVFVVEQKEETADKTNLKNVKERYDSLFGRVDFLPIGFEEFANNIDKYLVY